VVTVVCRTMTNKGHLLSSHTRSRRPPLTMTDRQLCLSSVVISYSQSQATVDNDRQTVVLVIVVISYSQAAVDND